MSSTGFGRTEVDLGSNLPSRLVLSNMGTELVVGVLDHSKIVSERLFAVTDIAPTRISASVSFLIVLW